MKHTLIKVTLAALAVVLLGSCEKINQRIDALEDRLDGIETEKIASIDSQIASINSSIADLGTIRGNISDLKKSSENHGIDIFNLEEADRALNDRILNLEDYLDDVLPTYAEKDWVKATFSTLAQYEATCDTIAKIDARIGRLDERLSKDIKDCVDSMKRWVNVQFEAYYTAAEMDAALEYMQAEIDSLKSGSSDYKLDSLANELTKTKAAVDSAKAQLTREYKAAIDTAITHCEGKLTKALNDAITEVNGKITSLAGRVSALESSVATLTGRVSALESMIQAVTIVPAYSDGSVQAEDDTLYIDCIISPASAVSGLTKANFTVLVNKVLTKAVDIKTIAITDDKWFSRNASNGTVSLKVPVKNYIPANADSAITVAVNVENGISHFTTEFVPVTVAAAKPTVEYVEIGGVKWALENLAVSESGKREFKNTGHVIGDYFQWATYAGYCGDASGSDKGLLIYSSFTSTLCGDAENSFTFKDASYKFSIPSWGEGIAPYYTEDEGYTKYTGDAVSTLESTDDAATIILGEEWRMPTIEEYQSLYNATYWAWDATDCGYYVFLPSDAPGKSAGTYGAITDLNKSKAKLFFPAAGNGTATSLNNAGSKGYYWSSSLFTDNTNAYYLFFISNYVSPQSNNVRYFGFSVRPVKDAAKPLPAGALKGEFSVSADKKVHFSQGNLQATYSTTGNTYSWGFATNQYAYIGNAAGNTTIDSQTDGAVVDLFGWSTSTNGGTSTTDNYGIKTSTTNSDYSGDFYDWGKNIGDGNTWRTLSKDEWTYLFNTRTASTVSGAENARYAKATVNSKAGVILLPDTYAHPEGVSALTNINTADAAFTANTYDSANWAKMESAGAVFLPAAGYRSGSNVSYVGEIGYYWSSTASDSDSAYYVYFYSLGVSPASYGRNAGYSVRLITESK